MIYNNHIEVFSVSLYKNTENIDLEGNGTQSVLEKDYH